VLNYIACRSDELLASKSAPTPTETVTVTPTPSGSADPSDPADPTGTVDPTATVDPTSTATATPAGTVCSKPVWTSSKNGEQYGVQVDPWGKVPNPGLGTYGQAIVHNNMWNASSYPGTTQSMGACGYDSWYAVTTASNATGDGAVKTYPNVHVDYIDWGTGQMQPLSDFSSLRMRFAHQAPQTAGIWNVAFDVWLNGVGDGAANEVMIWTENHNQLPAGRKLATVTLSGVQWDFWKAYQGHYLAFVPTNGQAITSGELDFKQFSNWLAANGHIPAASTLGQLDYGVEVVSTGGQPARFDFTDFHVTEVP
jgi:hypothetical protein